MTTRSDIWMALYIGDYLRDTGHLTPAEHGSYLLLLMHAWANGGALPFEDDQLRRVARMDRREWKHSGKVVMAFFRLDGSAWRHKRIDEELANTQALTEKRQSAGKAAADARWNKRAAQADSGASDTHERADAARNAIAPEKEYESHTQSQSQIDSASLRSAGAPSGGVATEPLTESEIPTQLWRQGLAMLRGLTRKGDGPGRKLIGRFLDAADGDHAVVLDVLRKAEIQQPDQPIPWITAAIQARATAQGGGVPLLSLVPAPPDPYGIRAWLRRQPDVTPGTHPITGETVPTVGGYAIEGLADQIATAADLPETWNGNWNAMGAWVRDGLEITDPVLAAIAEQARRMNENIRSIAVFDATVRRVARRVA